jgi:hypothetical protein
MALKVTHLGNSISIRSGKVFSRDADGDDRFAYSLSYSEPFKLIPDQKRLFTIDFEIPEDYEFYVINCPTLKSAPYAYIETLDNLQFCIKNTTSRDDYAFEKNICFAHLIIYKDDEFQDS